MSAHLTLPQKDEVQSDAIHLVVAEPRDVRIHERQAGTTQSGRRLGMLGLFVSASILGFSVYFILRYLL